jgi:asparagine synthase (glutamine-hydrolysing)
MCGIAGILARRHAPEPIALRRMVGALDHRGPDASGIYRDVECELAHTRLAIIDLAGGVQPMHAVAGDTVIVFNGEIFNYVELRAELRALGHGFRTQSDTEVVIEAFRAWGNDAFARFNGQFAIALWQPRSRTLTLARDHLGVRPLHVCAHRDRILFASEIKAIFAADREISRELDPVGLAETFTFWTVVAPRTAFRAVEELRPGHVRTYAPDGMRERCFWRPRFPADGAPRSATLDDATAALGDALERATMLRLLRADVPVGCYLSGGLDSSVIAALAHRAHGPQLRTFSLRFTDAEYDEGEFQRAMVARLDSDHHEVAVSRADIAEVFPEVVRHAERPVLRTAPAPMMLLSRFVRDAGLKVVLTGEGADEMLAGYDLFREARVRRFWAREPGSTRRPRLLDRLYPYLARSPAAGRAMAHGFFGRDLDRPDAPDFAHGPRWHAARALQRLFSADLRAALADRDPIADLVATLPAELATWDPLARDQYVEIRTLLSGYLLSAQGDRMAMASSVEGRFPFLDTEVVELACSLPGEYKLRVLDEKHVLKRIAASIVPAAIVRRPKQPYRAPDALAFAGDQRPAWVDEVLARSAVIACGAFDPDAVDRLWAKCRAAPAQLSNADNMALVGVLSAQLLHRELVCSTDQHVERRQHVERLR